MKINEIIIILESKLNFNLRYGNRIESRGRNFLELSVVERQGSCCDARDKTKNYLTDTGENVQKWTRVFSTRR